MYRTCSLSYNTNHVLNCINCVASCLNMLLNYGASSSLLDWTLTLYLVA
jgi:hypothetical protein